MRTDISDAMRRGDDIEALGLAREAVIGQPDDADAHHALALCLQRAGDVPGAVQAVQTAIHLAPAVAEYRYTLATLSLGSGAIEQARSAALAAAAANPNHLPAYASLVHLALARGDQDEAEAYLKLAMRVSAEHPRTLVAKAQLQQFKGEQDSALVTLTEAVQLDPGNAMAQLMLGLAYHARGQEAFAEQALRNACSLLPADPSLRWTLLECLRRQGRHEEMLVELDQVLAGSPDDAKALSWRVGVQGMLGRVDAALVDADRLVRDRWQDEARMEQALRLLAGMAPEALCLAWLEDQVRLSGGAPGPWRLRLAMTPADQVEVQLARWESAVPESTEREAWMAQLAEAHGQFDLASQRAATSTRRDSRRLDAQMVLLRAAIRRREADLPGRLADLEQLFSDSPQALRSIAEWRYLALDAAGHFQPAALAMQKSPVRELAVLPLPRPRGSESPGAASGRGGVLLWGQPGSRVERLVDGLVEVGLPVLQDRIHAEGRGDGYDALLRLGAVRASNQEREERILAMGLDPSTAIDWIPHWDGATAASARGARLWAVVRDPRDQLLNWLAGGSRLGFRIPSPEIAAEWMAQSLVMLADALAAGDDSISLLRSDSLDVDEAPLSAQIAGLLGRHDALPLAVAGPRRFMLGGIPSDFPAGHWRNYRDSFGEAFRRLSPVAVRLGYPAE